MFTITFQKACKRYIFEWIFLNVDLKIESGKKYAITGPNGSGKSTFLKLLLGTIDPSKGKVHYEFNNKQIDVSNAFEYFSFAAPYMSLIETYTLREMYDFHFGFKKGFENITFKDFKEICELERFKNKYIKQYSSGMKQRLKLGLAILSDTPVLVLDEPTTNLDEKSKLWFQAMLERYLGNRTLIIASNESFDIALTDYNIDISLFKKRI